jgi:hypothetical protein
MFVDIRILRKRFPGVFDSAAEQMVEVSSDQIWALIGRRPHAPRGPGTELKAVLKTIGITAKPNCSCNKRAKVMDEKGCDWCEENIDEIDGWLAEESKKRKLPYISLAGKTLIRMAIRRARKKGNGK